MLTIIYQVITLGIVVLLIRSVFKEDNLSMRLTAAIALIPFILRLLMIK